MKEIVIATTTFYKSQDELRFRLACELVKKAVARGYKVFVVDGSPDPVIAKTLSFLGAFVEREKERGMGNSRRQVFDVVYQNFLDNQEIIIWTEAEKFDIIRFIPQIIEPIIKGDASIVIPSRTQKSWETYPKFQQESEQIANLVYYKTTGISSDPMFGPVAFDYVASQFLANFDSKGYGIADNYIQHYAPILAKSMKFKITSVELDFEYPSEQKIEEEVGDYFLDMVEKRLWQLKQLVEAYFVLSRSLK